MIFKYFIHSINNNSYIYIIKHQNNTLVLDIDIIINEQEECIE